MVSIGEEGYLEATRRILATARHGQATASRAIPGLHVLGDPLWVIAFALRGRLDIYQVMERHERAGAGA